MIATASTNTNSFLKDTLTSEYSYDVATRHTLSICRRGLENIKIRFVNCMDRVCCRIKEKSLIGYAPIEYKKDRVEMELNPICMRTI